MYYIAHPFVYRYKQRVPAACFIYLYTTTACAAYLSFIVGMIVQLAPQWGEERVLLAFFPLLVLLSW